MDRLRAMEVFAAVAEAGSMSAAARRLGLANATVTTVLRNLETHLGAALVHRSTRRLRLTEAGAALYPQCRDILARVAAAEACARDDPGRLSGVLRVHMPIAVGHAVLAPAMADFTAAHPGVQLVTLLGNESGNLLRDGFDIAVRIDEVEGAELIARPLYRGRHVLCASPGFLDRHGVLDSPGALDPTHCLGFVNSAMGTPRRWGFQRGADTTRVTPAASLAFNSSDALMRAAARGAGFVYVLDLLVRPLLDRGTLTALLPGWETEEQTFYVVYPRTRFVPPKVRAFADLLARAFPAQATGVPFPAVPVRQRG
jgi:LysR family transcriptional regulator for bpeEF and oprC